MAAESASLVPDRATIRPTGATKAVKRVGLTARASSTPPWIEKPARASWERLGDVASPNPVRWQHGPVNDDLLELISIDPTICHGQPCIKGTRIMVTIVLDALAAGLDTAEILRHYPTLTSDGVRAAAAYGAWLAKQEIRTLTPAP